MTNIDFKSIIVTIGVLGFVLIVTTLHIVQNNYNPTHQLMSELALGQHGSYMLFAFLSFSVAIFVAQQILGAYENSMSVRMLMVIASFFIAGAGLFKLDNYINLHVGLVAVAFILIVLSMYLVPRFIPQFQELLPNSVCWLLGVGTVVSVALGRSLISIGIAQRLAASCILIWLLWLAIFHQRKIGQIR